MLLVSCIIAGLVQWLLVLCRVGIVIISLVNVLFVIWVVLIVAPAWPNIPWEVIVVVGVVGISTVMALGQRKR